MHAVPHPEPHVAGYGEGFLADGFIFNDVGDINQSGQLLMHSIIRCPHPVLVVIGAIHLDEHTMLGRNGVDIAIAVVAIVLLVAVEILPRAFQLAKFCLWCHVASLEIAA